MSARDDYPMYDGDSYDPAMDEIDRLRAQLERTRCELAGTAARIAAWDDALGDVVPDLAQQMGERWQTP